jgi:8-oxo-dGTP pyrophosphatase MutT (NUDIX family)
MNVTIRSNGMLTRALEFLRPAFVQAAALCLRDSKNGPQVLLVQTFRRRHWITPKGWPVQGKTLAEAAALEAWEEAGVRGQLHPEPVGAFTYTKLKKSGLPVQCRPQVFRIDVETLADDYPEASKRQREWFDLPEAIEAVHNPELKDLLRQL